MVITLTLNYRFGKPALHNPCIKHPLHLPTDTLTFSGATGFPFLPHHSSCCSQHQFSNTVSTTRPSPSPYPVAWLGLGTQPSPPQALLPRLHSPSRGPFPGAGRRRADSQYGARPALEKLIERSSSFSTASYCWRPPPDSLGGSRSERWGGRKIKNESKLG